MVNKANTPEEIDFILKAIMVMQDLNDLMKRVHGENAETKKIDANIDLLRKSIKDQLQ